ncbi:hypothetical protein GOP47_0019625 [Adiantum capillus-veneris]|uniref:Uncharacterized protein n=1 Tax=Adiantum capillus-veneris TaxID=13818 RepID=A0A9D4Z8N0_ADICA|nr:hypothetical protein GOP47_0019625 [Adiantum capillus-veneris]
MQNHAFVALATLLLCSELVQGNKWGSTQDAPSLYHEEAEEGWVTVESIEGKKEEKRGGETQFLPKSQQYPKNTSPMILVSEKTMCILQIPVIMVLASFSLACPYF